MRAQGKSQGEVIEVTATLKDSKGGLACRRTDAVHGPPPRGLFRFKLAGKLSQLFGAAEGLAGRPIIDATGLTGTFEWKVDFTAATRVVAEAPSLFAAFEQQLGLRLRPAVADVVVRVIESLEQPTELAAVKIEDVGDTEYLIPAGLPRRSGGSRGRRPQPTEDQGRSRQGASLDRLVHPRAVVPRTPRAPTETSNVGASRADVAGYSPPPWSGAEAD